MRAMVPGANDMPYSLYAFGLHVQADLPIPGAQPAPHQRTPNVSVILAPPLPAGGRQTHGDPYTLGPDSLLFSMPGVADYRCDLRGDRLSIAPHAAAPESLLAEYLIATALPALLWCRGVTMLHAAAALLPDRTAAVAIAGPSGIGKSTLLRKLLQAGADVVADDSLALRPAGSGLPVASGLPACTRQAEPACFLPVPHDRQQALSPLRHLIELVPDGPVRLQIQHGPPALAVLLRNLHRPRVPHLLGQDAALLATLASLTASLAIHRWDAEEARSCSPADLLNLLP